jgi:hypothetical protein
MNMRVSRVILVLAAVAALSACDDDDKGQGGGGGGRFEESEREGFIRLPDVTVTSAGRGGMARGPYIKGKLVSPNGERADVTVQWQYVGAAAALLSAGALVLYRREDGDEGAPA